MLKFLKRLYKSIALLPVVIALSFILLAIALSWIPVDYESYAVTRFLVVKDATDAQNIFSFLIGGIFTLTIFSYTMVMNVLNRNINNYSPRLIPLILAERHHQLILGFTSGTIIFAMVMSLNLNNVKDDYFPDIAAGLGIIFAIFCVLLFIYFIHSVSQSIHINYILKEVYVKALEDLKKDQFPSKCFSNNDHPALDHAITNPGSCGYLHHFDYQALSKDLNAIGCDIYICRPVGSFIQEDELIFQSSKELSDDQVDKIFSHFVIDHTVCSNVFEVSIKHLVEVAVKGCSPAINDPGTSLGALDYITQLLQKRFNQNLHNCYQLDKNNHIYFDRITNEELYTYTYKELYHYLKNDPILREAVEVSRRKLLNNTTNQDYLTRKLIDLE
ncbi:MAG: DUF2254 family protein [Nonlabens sp.]